MSFPGPSALPHRTQKHLSWQRDAREAREEQVCRRHEIKVETSKETQVFAGKRDGWINSPPAGEGDQPPETRRP